MSNVHFNVVGVGRIEGSGVVRVDADAHTLGRSAWIAPRRLEVVNVGTDVEVWNLRVDELSVTGGALLRVTHGPARTRELYIDLTGTLDLSDRWLEVDYEGISPLNEIRALLTRGYAGGAWTGTGISSTAAAATPGRALGYAEVSEVPASFPSMDDSTVVVRLTRYGDANLDGAVNLQDFNRLAANFGASNAHWHQGDFNYDGRVNLHDFNRLAGQFGQTASPFEEAEIGQQSPTEAEGQRVISAL